MIKKYNINDLMLGRYVYTYTITGGNIIVTGERMGVLYFNDDVCVDLIAEEKVLKQNIITQKNFTFIIINFIFLRTIN